MSRENDFMNIQPGDMIVWRGLGILVDSVEFLPGLKFPYFSGVDKNVPQYKYGKRSIFDYYRTGRYVVKGDYDVELYV